MAAIRTALLTATALTLFSTAALAADGTFDRTLKVNGPVLLGLDTGSGDVHISTGPVSTVHIVGHVHAGSSWLGGGSAEDRVRQVDSKPPITQAGNIISVGRDFHVQNVSIDYDVTTPRGTDLRVQTGSGNINASDIGGPVELRTGSGNIQGSGLSDHVVLFTGSGNIQAGITAALDVKAQTGSGNIDLAGVQSGLWAQSGSGNLKISGRPLAAWHLESGNGDIALNIGNAPILLNATTGSGDIHYSGGTLQQQKTASRQHVVGNANGGGPVVRATTGSGNIQVN